MLHMPLPLFDGEFSLASSLQVRRVVSSDGAKPLSDGEKEMLIKGFSRKEQYSVGALHRPRY
jgi:hypothetical protein